MGLPLPRPVDRSTSADESSTVPLGDHLLMIRACPDGSHVLTLIGPSGLQALTIELTSQGPRLRMEAGLSLAFSGELIIDAKRVAIHGREGLALTSGADATVAAKGDLTTSARVQTISAELGDVRVKANDDVRLNGERILMNC
jgi:hypothetical protein